MLVDAPFAVAIAAGELGLRREGKIAACEGNRFGGTCCCSYAGCYIPAWHDACVCCGVLECESVEAPAARGVQVLVCVREIRGQCIVRSHSPSQATICVGSTGKRGSATINGWRLYHYLYEF